MSNKTGPVLGSVAVVLAAGALAVSLTHSGPRGHDGAKGARGPQGSAGQVGKNAETANLGVCVTTEEDNSTGDMSFVNVTSPTLTSGVASCMAGQFVSIVPQTQPGS